MGIQAQNGAAIALNVADGIQPGIEPIHGPKIRHDNQGMHLARLTMAFVDTGYFASYEKAYLSGTGPGHLVLYLVRQIRVKLIGPVSGFFKLFFKLCGPFGMGAVARTQETDALVLGAKPKILWI